MAFYLHVDGTDDKGTVAHHSSLDLVSNFKISITFSPKDLNSSQKYLLSKNNSYAIIWEYTNNTIEFYAGSYTGNSNPRTNTGIVIPDTNKHTITYEYDGTTQRGYLDGVEKFALTKTFGLVSNTSALTIASAGNANYFAGNLYDLAIYKDGVLSLELLMDEGTGTTLNDTSGNGNHATLTGGTWLDDGTGGEEPVGEDGSTVFDTRQSIYSDETLSYDFLQRIYADMATSFDTRFISYQDSAQSFDTKQAIYEASAVHMDTKQVIYEVASTAFDMLQEYYQDGMTGATPFDIRIQLYEDNATLFDSRQERYSDGYTLADLQQAIYEVGKLDGDVRLILYADSATQADTAQFIYSDDLTHFDTKQVLYDTDNQIIGVIHLKGERKLYIEIKGKRELYIPLKGGVSMTVNNPTVSIVAGDSKYLVVSVDGISDLTGCTFEWGLHPRNGENVITKSSTSGINIVDGKVQIKLDPADTEALNGVYYHECEMTDTLGNISTIFTGLVSVSKSSV